MNDYYITIFYFNKNHQTFTKLNQNSFYQFLNDNTYKSTPEKEEKINNFVINLYIYLPKNVYKFIFCSFQSIYINVEII